MNFSKYDIRGNKVWENDNISVASSGTAIYIWDVIDNQSNILYVGQLASTINPGLKDFMESLQNTYKGIWAGGELLIAYKTLLLSIFYSNHLIYFG